MRVRIFASVLGTDVLKQAYAYKRQIYNTPNMYMIKRTTQRCELAQRCAQMTCLKDLTKQALEASQSLLSVVGHTPHQRLRLPPPIRSCPDAQYPARMYARERASMCEWVGRSVRLCVHARTELASPPHSLTHPPGRP